MARLNFGVGRELTTFQGEANGPTVQADDGPQENCTSSATSDGNVPSELISLIVSKCPIVRLCTEINDMCDGKS